MMLKNRGRGSISVRLAILTLVILSASGCSKVTGRRTVQPGNIAPTAESEYSALQGIVIQNDVARRQMILQELGSDIETTLNYDATTQVTDKYGSLKSGEEVEEGEILEADYTPGLGKIAAMRVPEEVWEYQEVSKYSIDNEQKSMEFAERKYQYSNQTYIGSSGQTIELMELNKQDVLTVRGVDYFVYSIVRTKGHGYIRLKNYDDFVGGMIEIGNGMILPVTKNMLLTVREGTYRVVLCKGSMSAVKTATVQMDKEIMLDFSDYQPAAQRIGKVTFQIAPKGADLTINGSPVDYSDPLPLLYGSYRISVTMTGYTEYSGILKVREPSPTIKINLMDEEVSVLDTTTKPDNSSKESISSGITKKIDSDHTITVSAPEGAEVYLDNVYKGLAPCTFTKVIGSQTLTLRRDGYVTKSYSIDILNDGKDATLSFSDLVESSGSATTAEPEEEESESPAYG